ncbi:MAG: hypothetical protein IKP12_00920 [Acholeplasmatales bacterium]|nr:hypothetical protein [Acholeplasmatales bacterium]
MKELYRGYKVIYNYYNLNIIAAIIGNIGMAFFNALIMVNGGSLFLIGAILFYSLMSLLRISTYILYKKNKSILMIGRIYAIASSIIYLLIPSLLVYVLVEKEYNGFFLDWFIYAYALYATLKMTFAFMHIKRTIVEKNIYLMDVKLSNIVLAFYTIFLLAFSLINENGTMDYAMKTIMLFLNGIVILVSIASIIIMYKIIRWGKKND